MQMGWTLPLSYIDGHQAQKDQLLDWECRSTEYPTQRMSGDIRVKCGVSSMTLRGNIAAFQL